MASGVRLADLGQTYRPYPSATFDERFGPYNVGPVRDQDLIRRLFEQQMLGPEGIVPGSRTWPSGNTLTELGARPMQLAGDVGAVPLPQSDPRNPVLERRGYGSPPVKVLPRDRLEEAYRNGRISKQEYLDQLLR